MCHVLKLSDQDKTIKLYSSVTLLIHNSSDSHLSRVSLTYRQGVYLLKIACFNIPYLLFSKLKYHCSFVLEDWDCQKGSGRQYQMITTHRTGHDFKETPSFTGVLKF